MPAALINNFFVSTVGQWAIILHINVCPPPFGCLLSPTFRWSCSAISTLLLFFPPNNVCLSLRYCLFSFLDLFIDLLFIYLLFISLDALDFLLPPSFPSLSGTLFVFFAVPSLDCSSLVYFCRCLFAVVTGADYVGLSSFCPSHCLCPRSIMSFTFRAASHWCGAPGGEIEWEENQTVWCL